MPDILPQIGLVDLLCHSWGEIIEFLEGFVSSLPNNVPSIALHLEVIVQIDRPISVLSLHLLLRVRTDAKDWLKSSLPFLWLLLLDVRRVLASLFHLSY